MGEHLKTQLQEYVHLSRYARWIEEEKRRETWPETVARYCDFFENKFPGLFPREAVYTAILNCEVMPSMRALMTAGPALERDNMCGYNCSYVPIDHPRAFDEIAYILMCGTGVGFSVERHYISKLPIIGLKVVDGEIHAAEELVHVDHTIVVPDSRHGWASSFRELVSHLYAGEVPKWDMGKIRPKGARLKVMGGRASGPEPLEELFRFTVALFRGAVGRKLTSLECHDLVCKIADIVVVGGVRRSALISLSNVSDGRMRHAKSGAWWEQHGQRALANNSAVYSERPDMQCFFDEWKALFESKSGERGIFNRAAAVQKVESLELRDKNYEFGTNPCGEIILRPKGLCNLSEVVLRHGDTHLDILRKIEVAAIVGTFQSALTNFKYVRPVWRQNAEEERLLGVSMTGIMDVGEDMLSPTNLDQYRAHANQVNAEWAEKLGISPSVAVTTVKPSGTVSQLVDSASGIHPRWSQYYVRSVRADKKDPLAQMMRANGFPVEDDVTKPDTTDVFYFPCVSPEKSVKRDQLTAIDQLEQYLKFRNIYCDHNASTTIYVREHEWFAVGDWVYRHFDELGGVSFLPHSDHIYRQAPYQECTKAEYEELCAKMPNIDWVTELAKFETEDMTTGTHELACSAGVCEIL